MKSNHQGQIGLSKLIFTHNWEDPAVDERALGIKNGDTVFTITSGGCNTLGFLRFSPSRIFCVDINPCQTYLMELKQAAFRNLDYEELISFLGLKHHPGRWKTFLTIARDLSRAGNEFWKNNPRIIQKGVFMNGRYERFVRIAGWLLRTIQGSSKTRKLFSLETLQAQKEFYAREWDNTRWRWIFNTMFNKKRLAKKGLNEDYFHFDDGASSFSESFRSRAAHAIQDLSIQENYFLSLYLLGRYLSDSSVPPYLQADHFEVIKKNIDRITPVTADSKYWLETQPDNTFHAMALSNICELMDDTDTAKLFSEVYRTSAAHGRLVFRNLMIPRDVPEVLRKQILKDEELSRKIQFEDRSFVYGKVAAYRIIK